LKSNGPPNILHASIINIKLHNSF